MATSIRVKCEWCGLVEVQPDDITLDGYIYRYTCPMCDSTMSRHATRRIIVILTNLGCPTEPGPITEAEIDQFIIAMDNL